MKIGKKEKGVVFCTLCLCFVILFPSSLVYSSAWFASLSSSSSSSLRASVGAERQISSSSLRTLGVSRGDVPLRYIMFPREQRFLDTREQGQQPISGFAPTGLSSYGSLTTTYTQGVRGVMSFNQLDIGYFSSTLLNNSNVVQFSGTGSASLQENSFLWLGEGLAGVYWVQNVVLINQTLGYQYELQLVNNIWNFSTVTNSIESGGVQGNGSPQCIVLNNQKSCPYIYVDPNIFSVTIPFSITLTMTAAQSATGAATVNFEYLIESQSQNVSGVYDSVIFLPGSPPLSSYFQIGGDTPLGISLPGGTSFAFPSDFEYVIGGPGGGSSVFVNSIMASEELLYEDNQGAFVPTTDAFSTGSVTGEQAFGITVSRNFNDLSFPGASLNSGYVSAYEVWPEPPILSTISVENYESGSVDLSGRLMYSVDSSNSRLVAIAGARIEESINDSLVANTTTDEGGGFALTFKPSSPGIYLLSVIYPGSVALLERQNQATFVVSLLNITGTSYNSGLDAIFNDTVHVALFNTSRILVPVQSGSSVSVSFANSTSNEGLSSTILVGVFRSINAEQGSSLQTPARLANLIVLNGSSSAQFINVRFVTQFFVSISNPYVGTDSVVWVNASEPLKLSAPSLILSSGQIMTFSGWFVNGKLASTNNDASIKVNSSISIVAEYSSFVGTLLVFIVIPTTLFIVGLLIGYLLWKYHKVGRGSSVGVPYESEIK